MRIFKAILVMLCIFLMGCQKNDISPSDNNITQQQQAAALNARLALAYLAQGQQKRAKAKLLKALQQDNNSLDANAAMAYFYETSGQDDLAQIYHKKALSLSHRSGPQLNNYGAFLCRTGRYHQSLEYFEAAVKDTNYLNTAAAYENAGVCSLALSDPERAKIYFMNALKIDPKRKKSLRELVNIAKKQEDPVTIVQAAKIQPRAFERETTLANALAWASAANKKGIGE